MIFSPDEEIGSPASKPIIQELAADHDVAIGLEAARINGDLVSARKGIAALEVRVTGRAVHAGVRPEKGASAALEAVSEIVERQTVDGTSSTVRLLHRHPPMERTAALMALVAEAQRVARDLGFEVGHTATGGAGDANTTATAGVPTIDGLAPVGGEAHGPSEWLDLDSVVPRTALLAGLLARLGAARPQAGA